jgi:GTP cyclohydrolase IA
LSLETTNMKNKKNSSNYEAILIDEIGESHFSTTAETPIRADAFLLNDDEKIEIISGHFKEIMQTLGLDMTDDSLKGTPLRVAKMYVKELFQGLNPANQPSTTLFENQYQYGEMLVERNIEFYSNCEHHFVPIIGKVHVAYLSTGKVIGLSKLHRIVNYFARRPQVQERLTMQIGQCLVNALNSNDVAILIDADHLCVSSRGVQDNTSSTITAFYSGVFKEEKKKNEFLKYLTI